MDSAVLIQTVNQAAAQKISSLRGVYERRDFDVRRQGPIVEEVVNRLRRFATFSEPSWYQNPAE